MHVDTTNYFGTISEAREQAVRAEADGCHTWWATETKADVFLGAALGADATSEVRIGTGIAVAFARNPMTVAMQAHDLQTFSDGRFVLGLGSQVSAHVTRRFSMPWSHPAPRMREFILAVRAAWATFNAGERLDFRGDFYQHTLMSPMFDPGPTPHGAPPVHLAAVGPKMTEVAGEVADGIVVHGFATERWLREVTVPALRRGAAKAGRSLDGFEINAPGFVVVGEDQATIDAGLQVAKAQIGFYGSTPAYRGVLELHGWGAVGEELERLSKSGGWEQMGDVIDDEVLDAFTVSGAPAAVAAELRRRYGDVCTRVVVGSDDAGTIGALRAAMA